MLTRVYVLLFIFVSMMSCSEHQETTALYFDKFKHEANIRGVKVSCPTVVMTGKLKNNFHAYWDGVKIYVDTTSSTWKKFPEETMMHEYGHACLGRDHDFSRLPNGMYKSVMGNYSSAQYAGWTQNDTIRYREKYYLDELFNPKTKVPEWGY